MATSKDLGRVRLVWQGVYSASQQYTFLDAVSYEGSSYMCFTETPPPVGTLPTDEDYFLVLAEKGAPSDATENSYLWLKESGSVVQCSPVPESGLDLKVYFAPVETLPEEGEKGPENPSTISGWDSVEVVRCGKNVLNIHTDEVTPDEVTPEWVTIENDTIRVEPVTTSAVNFQRNTESTYPRDTRVTLSAMRNKEYAGRIYAFYGNSCFDQDWSDNKLIRSMTTVGNNLSAFVDKNGLQILQASSSSSINLVLDEILELKNIQIEIGDTATPYEPYVGNTYTVELPDTFYGGYVDFEHGVLVQEWARVTITSAGSLYTSVTDGLSGVVTGFPDAPLGQKYEQSLSSSLFYSSTPVGAQSALYNIRAVNNVLSVYLVMPKTIVGETIESWDEYLSDNPVQILYPLATPIEHQLSDLPTIKALAQSDRYTPQINTIFSNANGNVEVGYAKSPIQEHLDLANAITATGGANV